MIKGNDRQKPSCGYLFAGRQILKQFLLGRLENRAGSEIQLTTSYVLFSAFFAGVAATLLLANLMNVPVLLVCFLVSLILALRRPALAVLSAFICGHLVATIQFQQFIDNGFPSGWERKDIVADIKVLGMPNINGDIVRFNAEVLAQSTSVELDGLVGKKLNLSCYRCPIEIHAAQRWRVQLRLKRPHGFASPGAFDYEKYLFRHQVIAKGYIRFRGHDAQLLKQSQTGIHAMREAVKKSIFQALGEESLGASVVTALSIGDKSAFTQAQLSLLQNSGLSHLFAISGLHIGLVFVCVFCVFKCLFNLYPRLYEHVPRLYLCLPPALCAAVFYAALAGFAISTKRALIMLFVFAITRLMIRDISLLKCLLVAIFLIVCFDPFAVLDAGFWLSCGAVWVIYWVSEGKENVSLLRLQPALWVGMLPITIMTFGSVPLISPLLNLIAVPLFCFVLIPVTLLSVLLLQIGFTGISVLFLQALDMVYQSIFSSIEWILSSELTSINVPEFDLWQAVLFVVLIVLYRLESRWWLLALTMMMASLLAPVYANVKFGQVKVALLDVGQGLSMVIQAQDYVVVYDTGAKYSSGFTAAQAVLLPYLKNQGIKRVDTLIISHADNDHIGGYQTLVSQVEVGEVYSSRPDKVANAIPCVAGQSWVKQHVTFSMLGPEADTPLGSNNLSCVLKVTVTNKSILITGDIEKAVERYMVKRQAELLAADVMLVPHQGSKTSSTTEFINAVNPQLALVAAGYLNHYGHPHQDVVARYRQQQIDFYSTVDSGTIELTLQHDKISLDRHRQSHRRFWHWRKPDM